MAVTDDQLRDTAQRLVRLPAIVGVVLGGSRARGDHTPESDVDLGLYYRPPLNLQALGALACEVAGPQGSVTGPGEWGPWVDGGAWLTVADTPVDWIYRDLDRVRTAWNDATDGRYRFHAQTGHPLGVPDFAYAGELALGIVLADPAGELTELQRQTRDYPPRLGQALVAGLWEATFLIKIARKAVSRGDTAYIAGCLFRVVGLCAHAVHGYSGRWLTNEKGAVVSAGLLPAAPDHFAVRAHGVLAGLGTNAEQLDAALDAAADLVRDTEEACRPPQ